eukprot:6700322-Prymnesium_polylepis.1
MNHHARVPWSDIPHPRHYGGTRQVDGLRVFGGLLLVVIRVGCVLRDRSDATEGYESTRRGDGSDARDDA